MTFSTILDKRGFEDCSRWLSLVKDIIRGLRYASQIASPRREVVVRQAAIEELDRAKDVFLECMKSLNNATLGWTSKCLSLLPREIRDYFYIDAWSLDNKVYLLAAVSNVG